MITRRKLQNYLDHLLPLDGLVDCCPNGLQVEGREEITHIGCAVTASLATIEAAVAKGIDALIVHHGLFWNKEKETIEGTQKKKLKLLLENELSLFAYHLPLDKHPDVGNNWKAAKELEMSELSPFAQWGSSFIGVKGKIEPEQRDVFLHRIEAYYGHKAVCAFGGPSVIKTVGIVSGGAYRCIKDAAIEGLDAFITGSFDEPAWHMAFEEGVNFLALGHSATERIGPLALCTHLQKTFLLPCTFIDIENPF